MKYRVSERVLRPLAANPHVVAQTELQLDARVELGGGEGGHAGEHGGPAGWQFNRTHFGHEFWLEKPLGLRFPTLIKSG